MTIKSAAEEADIELLVAQALDLFCAQTFVQRERHLRIGGPKFADDGRYEGMKQCRGLYADKEASLFATGRTACCLERAVVVRKGCTRSVEKNAPGFGQLDPARLAEKELHVELVFNRLDPLTERGLLQAKALRGSGDVTLLRDGNELAKMAQLHGISLSI